MANQLYHHGIEGQRWGVRNGPPYPLTTEAREKTKEQAIKEGSAGDIRKYTDEMTNKEIIDALNRIKWMEELDKIAAKQDPSVMNRIDSVMKKVGTVKNWLATSYATYVIIDKIVKAAGGKSNT